MRKYLALAFALSLSVVAIGSPEPDRQTPDIEFAQAIDLGISNDLNFVATLAFESTNEATFDYSGMEAEFSVDQIDLKISEGLISKPVLVERGLGDLVIEESPKPRDSYKLPIWDFTPLVEPPSI